MHGAPSRWLTEMRTELSSERPSRRGRSGDGREEAVPTDRPQEADEFTGKDFFFPSDQVHFLQLS